MQILEKFKRGPKIVKAENWFKLNTCTQKKIIYIEIMMNHNDNGSCNKNNEVKKENWM